MYKHPGVYIEELPSGVIPIEAASTSVAAFIGPVRRGPINQPRFITGVTQFEKDFGEMNDTAGGIRDFGDDPDYFGHAVHAFFGNGGKKAYIVRVANEAGPNTAEKSFAAIFDPDKPNDRAFYFETKSEGNWGNCLVASLSQVDATDTSLGYEVQIGTIEEGQFEALETFTDLSLEDTSGKYLESVINDQSALVTVKRELIPTTTAENGGETTALLSGSLQGFDFTTLDNLTLSVTVDGGTTNATTVVVGFDPTVVDIQSAASFIENAVGGGFQAQVTKDNQLLLISGSRGYGSGVSVANSGAAPALKFDGASMEIPYPDGGKKMAFQSGSLAERGFSPLNGKTLKVILDGVSAEAVEITFGPTHTNLDTVAAFIQTQVIAGGSGTAFSGFTASVTDDGSLLLVSGTSIASSSVIIGAVTSPLVTAKMVLKFTNPGSGNSLQSDSLAGISFWPLSGKKLKVVLDGTTGVDILFADAQRTLEEVAAFIQQTVRTGTNLPESRKKFQALVSEDQSLLLVSGSRGPISNVSLVTVAPSAETVLKFTGQGSGSIPFHPPGGSSRFMGGEDGDDNLDVTNYNKAFDILKDYRDVSIILLPGVSYEKGDPPMVGGLIIDAAITHSETMKNRVVVVDPAESSTFISPKSVKIDGLPTSSHAALYYPWMQVPNPHFHPEIAANLPSTFNVGPSAFAAGIWARIDGTRGVWKAPAGLEASVRGSLGPSKVIGDDIQDNLNDLGINCIRSIIGPPVVWGARMLSTKVQPDFRYVPIRRTSAMIGESLYNALQAVVFEPNKHILWSALRSNIGNFMDGLFRAGAFQGEKASDAYFVRCNLDDTMTQADVDKGIVRVIVGYAALKPAEFVVIQLKQKVGQSTS